MKTYKVTFTDTIEGEDEFAAYDEMLKYLGSVVEYGDLTAFDFEEVTPTPEQ